MALTINTNMGEQKPFTLYLREFKGIKRRNVTGGHPAWTPGATHIDLTVPDADELWSKLKAANMLWARTWDSKLIAAPGSTGRSSRSRRVNNFISNLPEA